MRAVLAALVLVALAAPATASAHATLLKTTPENGAVVDRAPAAITVTFDDTVRVAGGNAAVDNATQTSVLGGSARAHGSTLTIPLRPGLPDGAYSVRWSVVSQDGHREEGVLAFGVGAGSASPTSVLGASVPLTWNDILLRTLYYLGLLAGGGAAVFGILTRKLLGDALRRPLAQLLFFALLFTFLGGSGIVHAAPPGTRFALVLKVALIVSLAGGAAAALAPTIPRLTEASAAAALALLAAPTLSGHALDHDQPRALSIVADLAHMASASVWLGGLLAIVYVVPRASTDDATRKAAVGRFSTAALISVAVLGVTGIVRAVTELGAVSQIWTTSYGRALIVKTAVFVPLLGVGWLNRAVLMRVFARLRRSATVEVIAIAGIVVAVAILTELRPGTEASKALAAAPLTAAQPPVLPPANAVVDARELGALAVAVARTPGRATVTLVSPDNTGVDGRRVTIDGRAATPCGSGCYRGPAEGGPLVVGVGAQNLRFAIPERAAPRTAQLASITRAFRASRSIVWDETLASGPTNAQTTRFTAVAPHSLSYDTPSGPAAIVIGGSRWDRPAPNTPWLRSTQSPIDVTTPYWTRPTNVHLASLNVLTFLDRRIPAWFRLTIGPSHPVEMHMTAAAHFMTDRYVSFDSRVTISPPPSR